MIKTKRTVLAAIVSLSLLGCNESTTNAPQSASAPTAQDAKTFLKNAQNDIAKMQTPAAHAEWSYATNINYDTAAVSAYFNEVLSTKVATLAKEAAQFNDVDVDADTRRQLNLLKNGLTMPPPSNPEEAERLAKIGSELSAMYGSGQYCREDGTCKSLVEMSGEMATLRDADTLLEYWEGWREVSKPMAPLYAEQVTLANKGASELGFANVSELWRGKYDMSADAFPKELDLSLIHI